MLDTTFDLEVAWFTQQNKSGARDTLRHDVLDSLPDGKSPAHVLASKSLADLTEIKGSSVYGFAKENAQSDVNVVLEWVKAIHNQRQPSFRFKDCVWLQACKDRLSFFVHHTTAGSNDTPGATVFGAEALSVMLQATKAKIDAKEEVTLGELKVYDTFAFLMSADDVKQHRTWVQVALRSKAAAQPQVAAQQQPQNAPNPQRRAAAAADTMSLFRRRRTT